MPLAGHRYGEKSSEERARSHSVVRIDAWCATERREQEELRDQDRSDQRERYFFLSSWGLRRALSGAFAGISIQPNRPL